MHLWVIESRNIMLRKIEKKREFKNANIQRNSIYYLGKRLTNTHSSYAIPNYAIKNSY